MAETKEQQPTPPKSPSERSWTVQALIQREDGVWVPDYAAVAYAFDELQSIMHRLGGIVQIGAKRVKLPEEGPYPPRLETEVLNIRWFSHSPVAPAAVTAEAEAPAG